MSRSASQGIDREKQVDALLESLHYGTAKEDREIIQELRDVFGIPPRTNLRTHLVNKIDFSELFVALLRIAQPFARMMSDIYEFLSAQRTTARSPSHLIVGESIRASISFDLDAFPRLYQRILQTMEGYLRAYDLDKLKDYSVSPLPYTESLLGCGHCTAPSYQKTAECSECGPEMVSRFENVFRALGEIIDILHTVTNCAFSKV